jgi:predicted component of type VI protein secretion system
MQSNIIVNQQISDNPNTNFQEYANILIEMEKMGIDPTPFTEIAALDLIKQFGDKALDYSVQIEQNFIIAGDAAKAKIWSKLSSQLSKISNSDIIAVR